MICKYSTTRQQLLYKLTSVYSCFFCRYSMTRATLIALTCTCFSIFNIPVFWPILVLYFIVLFTITMKRQIMVSFNMALYSLVKCQFEFLIAFGVARCPQCSDWIAYTYRQLLHVSICLHVLPACFKCHCVCTRSL